VGDAQAALKLTTSTVRREVREGRLRVSKRAGRYYLLGAWLLEWIAAGELPHRQREAKAASPAELAGRRNSRPGRTPAAALSGEQAGAMPAAPLPAGS
jgi:hypothetical protein